MVHKAAVTSDPQYTKAICQYGADMSELDSQNEEGATPLMLACQREEKEQVKELLEQGVSIISRKIVRVSGLLKYFLNRGVEKSK